MTRMPSIAYHRRGSRRLHSLLLQYRSPLSRGSQHAGGVGVDQQIGKKLMFNATWLFTRGVHQYLTDNVTAPEFDPSTYTVVGPLPSEYNYQFQSGGIYKQNQLIVTANTHFRHLSLHGSYTFNQAKSDTQGVNYVPRWRRILFWIMAAQPSARSPSLPAGHLLGAPWNHLCAAFGCSVWNALQPGDNGNDLTANNQFNARPTYGACGAADVVSTPYGCLDTDPVGKGERIVPYGVGLARPISSCICGLAK